MVIERITYQPYLKEARWAMGTAAIDGLTVNFLPQTGAYPFEVAK